MIMRKCILFWLFFVCIILSSISLVQAAPFFAMGEINEAFFNNREVWVDVDNNSQISKGDYFWGILHVQNIEDSQGNTMWSEDNVDRDGSIDTFTGYFYIEVLDIVTGDPNPYIIFGIPDQSDPNNIISDSERDSGVVMKLYVDDGSVPPATSFVNDVTKLGEATDGTFWASFGLDTGSYWDSENDTWTGNTYWYTQAPINPPTEGKVGISWFGLKIVDNNSGIPLFVGINDPDEDFADKTVSMYGESMITVADLTRNENNDGYSSGEIFESDDPVTIFPAPEPASIMLLGGALLSLAIYVRKKF